jgi:hypothetical protein
LFPVQPGILRTRWNETDDTHDALKGLVVGRDLIALSLIEALLADANELFAGEPGVVWPRGQEAGNADDALDRLVVGTTVRAGLLVEAFPADAH